MESSQEPGQGSRQGAGGCQCILVIHLPRNGQSEVSAVKSGDEMRVIARV